MVEAVYLPVGLLQVELVGHRGGDLRVVDVVPHLNSHIDKVILWSYSHLGIQLASLLDHSVSNRLENLKSVKIFALDVIKYF